MKLERLSNFGRSPVIVNKDFYNEDWMPKEEDFFLCQAGDITVYNHPEFEGGGKDIGRICADVLREIYPGRHFTDGMEWASGPAYIGFLLLGTGLCTNMTLCDIYRPALRAVEKTIANLPAKYEGKVDWYHIHGMADIPEDRKYDLIVGSPPHWDVYDHPFVNDVLYNDRRSADPHWLVHQELFANVKKNLKPDGILFLQEQSYASGPRTFEKWINEAGLKIVDVLWEPDDMQNNSHFYYMVVSHA